MERIMPQYRTWRRIRRRPFLALTLILISLYLVYTFWDPVKRIEPWQCQARTAEMTGNMVREKAKKSCQSNDIKLILFYTTLFGSKPWRDIDSTEDFLVDCPTKKCRISYDENDIGKSDLAIFHGGDIPRMGEVLQIHKYRCPHQRMAFLSHENALFTPKRFAPDGFFNWTISFKRTSDFVIPYGHYVPRHETANAIKEENVNFAVGKDKLVAWAVSHCGTVREKYVKELVKHMNVDIYGKCSGVYGQDKQCPRGSSECDLMFKTYKFYLAFENSMCTDYITEKFWRTLNWKVVPIVLTRDDYSDTAPPGSFISVQDFPSVKALADYLVYLDKNDTAYNEYFQWRRKFNSEQKHWFRFVGCDICDALHDECLQPKVYRNFDHFWNRIDCEQREISLLKLIDAN